MIPSKVFFSTIFVCIFAVNINALDAIQPLEILTPPIPDIDTGDIWAPDGILPAIYWMSFNEECLNIHFIHPYYDIGDQPYYLYNTWYIDWHASIQYDLENKLFTDPVVLDTLKKEDCLSCDPLEHDAYTVSLHGENLLLENAFKYIYGDEYDDYRQELSNAHFDADHNIIYGVTYGKGYWDHYHSIDIVFHIWDAETRKEYTALSEYLSLGGMQHFCYSPGRRYLIIRKFRCPADRIYLDVVEKKEFICAPHVVIIDLHELKKMEANLDAVFTSDDQFFVTNRNGSPTLTSVENDIELLQYSMPSPMISAVFSTDWKHIYIAGADNKIYVFESGVE